MKKCKDCNLQKPFEEFIKRKDSKDGYRNSCKECYSKYKKEYRLSNIDHIRNYNNNYRKKYNKTEKIKNYLLEYGRKYSKTEKFKINKRKYDKKRRENDPTYALTRGIRRLISLAINNKNYTKKSKTYEILGCTFEEFKIYIESKFESWMTWENKGLYNGELNYGWDIDHIIPISKANTEDELLKLNHYSNLQPLCSKINRDIKKDN